MGARIVSIGLRGALYDNHTGTIRGFSYVCTIKPPKASDGSCFYYHGDAELRFSVEGFGFGTRGKVGT